MVLKITRADRGENVERRVLWAMLTQRPVLAAVAPYYRPSLFSAREASLLGTLATDFFKRHNRAPCRDILSTYDEWAVSNKADPEQAGLLARLLQDLFDHYEDRPPLSVDVMIDEAERLFRNNDIRSQVDAILAEFEAGNAERALELFDAKKSFTPSIAKGSWLLGDEAAWERMFDAIGKPVIQFDPGALDNFFREIFLNESFVAFLGKEKGGKSHWLQWTAWEAAQQGRNVLYIEAGDSTEEQVRERFAARLMGRPLAAGKYQLPTGLEAAGTQFNTTVREERYREDVHKDMVRIAARRLAREWGQRVRLHCVPVGSLSASGLDGYIDRLASVDEWHPSVVIVDYADLLAPENSKWDKRDQIDETWKQLRAISQRRHCLVVTATQARREAYSEWVLKRDHITEDKRKLAHVTAMLGINQTPSEKAHNVTRLNVVCGRRLTFAEDTCLWCAGNLAYSNPAMVCTF